MSNTIVKISRRAKQIRKRHPSIKWQSAIKQASREIKSGKKSPARRKVSGTGKRKRKTAIKRLKTAHRREGKIIRSMGSINTVSSSVAHTKALIIERIGWMEASKLSARTAKTKRGIQKRINELKSTYRKLC